MGLDAITNALVSVLSSGARQAYDAYPSNVGEVLHANHRHVGQKVNEMLPHVKPLPYLDRPKLVPYKGPKLVRKPLKPVQKLKDLLEKINVDKVIDKDVPAPPLVTIEPNPGERAKKSKPSQPKLTPATVAKALERKGGGAKKASKRLLQNHLVNKKAPVSFGFNFTNSTPQITRRSNGSARYAHTEYVCDLQSSTTANAFKVQSFAGNTSNSALFPWLATQSVGFSMVKFHNVTFHFKSMCSTASAGTSMFSISVDSGTSAPTSKAEMLTTQNATRCNVWESMSLTVPHDILHRLPAYFTSASTASYASGNPGTRSMCILNVGSSGCTDGLAIGELYVTYDVDLMEPRPPTVLSAYLISTSTTMNSLSLNAISTGTTMLVQNIEVDGDASVNTLKIHHSGRWRLTFELTGTVLTSNGTIDIKDQYGLNQTFVTVNDLINAAGTVGIYTIETVNLTSCPFYVAYLTTQAGATRSSLYTTITQINPGEVGDLPGATVSHADYSRAHFPYVPVDVTPLPVSKDWVAV